MTPSLGAPLAVCTCPVGHAALSAYASSHSFRGSYVESLLATADEQASPSVTKWYMPSSFRGALSYAATT